MSAARTISALLVLSCFTLFGFVRASGIRKKAEDERGLLEDIRAVDQRMRLLKKPLPEIASELSACGRCAELWRGITDGMRRGLSFSEAANIADKPELSREALGALTELFSSLGSAGPEEECARLGCAAERLEAISLKTEAEYAARAKLVLRLSALAGAAAAILII